MGSLFSMDGLFYKIGTTIIDIIYMNILWIVFTVFGLFITGGAATSALVYVMQRRADNRGSCNFQEFFYGFKKNFKKSTLVWIIMLSVFTIVYININYIPFFQSIIQNTYITMVLFGVQIILIIELLIISIYIFNILVKYDYTIINLFKIAIVLGYRHILTTLTCMALIIVVTVGMFHVPIILLAGISGYTMLACIIMKNIIID